LPYVWVSQLLPERWHLVFDSGDNHLMNPGVASVQIMQVGSLVAARIVSMAMRGNSSRTNAGPALHRLSVPAIVSQPERWSKTKRNSTHISRCAQIDSNRIHFF
jgi:hypothetical protein